MSINFSYETNVGRKRDINEDSLWPQAEQHTYSAGDPYGMLFIVADGMGGHQSGEVASGLAVTEMSTTYYSLGEEVPDIGDRLRLAVQAAHQKIRDEAAEAPDKEKMGTTIAAAVVKYEQTDQKGTVWVAWVGDSRVYLWRRGRLQQLTKDHSFLWPQIEAGQLSWTQQRVHPQRSRINRALVAHHPVTTPDVLSFELEPGDRLLLCSDGLYGEVEPNALELTVAAYPPQEAVHYLIEQANSPKEIRNDNQRYLLEGGDDNISAIIIEIEKQRPVSTVSDTVPDLPVIEPKRSPWQALIGVAVVLLVLLVAGFLFVTDFGSDTAVTNASAPSQAPAAAAPPIEADEPDAAPQESIVIVSLADMREIIPTPTAEASLDALNGESVQTETRLPTATRGPISLPTQPPSPTPTPTATSLPTATPLPPTPTPELVVENPTAGPSIPTLIKPKPFGAGARQYSSNRDIEFVWQWPGELTDTLSFEIRVWLPGQERLGVHNASLLRQDATFKRLGDNTYAVSLTLEGATNVKQTSPDYSWSVGVVEIEPEYKWLGLESEPQRISILVPASGS